MPKGWFGSSNNDDDDLQLKPEEFQKQVKEDVTKSVTESLNTTLAPMLEFFNEQKRKEAEKTEADRLAAERAQHDKDRVQPNEFITDPESATRKSLQPLAQQTLILAAKMAKQETLADAEYYTGDIKTKVDSILSRQPLENQSLPDVIMNTYKIVMFDHQKEIAEGKIKSRNSSVVFGSGGTGGHNADDKSQSEDFMSDEEKRYAAKLGVSNKDWIAQRKELEYV